MKYRRKPTGDPTRPLHVDAVRFHATAAGHQEACRFVGLVMPFSDRDGTLALKCFEKETTVRDGDWIVRGQFGAIYVETPDVFERDYQPEG